MNGGLRPYDIRTNPAPLWTLPVRNAQNCSAVSMGWRVRAAAHGCPHRAYLPPLTFTVFLSVSVCRRLPGEPKELRWGPAPHPSHGLAILAGLLFPRRKAPDD